MPGAPNRPVVQESGFGPLLSESKSDVLPFELFLCIIFAKMRCDTATLDSFFF